MPILANAKKALKVSQKRAIINRRVKSKAKTAMDTFKKSPSQDGLSQAFSAIDRAVKGKMFHRNKAARLKSQLSRLVK